MAHCNDVVPSGTSCPIRVGFILFPIHLLGLHNYLRNLFAAIEDLPDTPIVPVLLTGRKQSSPAEEFVGVIRIKTSLLDRKSPAWFARKCIERICGRDMLLERFLRRNNISVLSHSVGLGGSSPVKTLGWIPDLQHIYLPHLFNAKERHQRNRNFKRLCDTCDAIAMSSNCGLQDLHNFHPSMGYKGRVLHFVSATMPRELATPLQVLENRYNFSGPYILLPNQFWDHKNHRVVIDALHLLNGQKQPVHVLCTGSTVGLHDSQYYDSLMEYAAQCAVLSNFKVLGVVPFGDLSGLMYGAAALLNPSLFEGWSTSVEEAKSLGKRVILSDIAVHREQDPEYATFFPPDAPDTLASALVDALAKYDSAEDLLRQQQAARQFAARRRVFGETYLHIVNSLTSQSGHPADNKIHRLQVGSKDADSTAAKTFT